MHIQRLDPEKLFEAYGIQVQMLYPWKDVVEPPFGAAWAVVPPAAAPSTTPTRRGRPSSSPRGAA